MSVVKKFGTLKVVRMRVGEREEEEEDEATMIDQIFSNTVGENERR